MFRNFFHTIRCFKAAFILNVLGLAVAFAASMMIMMQVRHDLTFDTCYEDAENIYRLDMRASLSNDTDIAVAPRPLADLFATSSPDITAGCIMAYFFRKDIRYEMTDNGRRTFMELPSVAVSADFPEVFGLNMVEGSWNALHGPGSAVIPASLAERLFGNGPALGKAISDAYTVTGVYKDFPGNASLQNDVYTAIPDEEDTDNWDEWNYYAFMKLSDGTSPEDIIRDFMDDSRIREMAKETDLRLYLHRLHDLHFDTGIGYDVFPKTSRTMIYALISVIFILTVIALINYTNFNISITPMRVRGMVTRKILGSSSTAIRCSIIAESMTFSLAAFLISVFILHLCGMSGMADLTDADISVSGNMPILLAGCVIALIAGGVSSIYPASLISSFPPASAFKGNPGLSPEGKNYRNVLISIQFIAAFSLLCITSFIFLQNRYMVNSPLGFAKDEIIVCEINGDINRKRSVFSEEIRKIPGVGNIGFTQALPGSSDFYSTWYRDFNGTAIQFFQISVSPSFPTAMGISIIEGRDFREDDLNSSTDLCIFNRTARDLYGVSPGDKSYNLEVIGISDDIRLASFRKEVTPGAMILTPQAWYSYAVVRIQAGTDLKAARAGIEKRLENFSPEYTPEVYFYNEVLEHTYRKEQRTGALVSLFSLIAIIISVVGVFSLVTFECGYRRKESSIRKVAGATSWELVRMFCRKYLAILGICFVISIPVSIIVVRRWFESFAYHIPLYWWVFPAVFIAIAAITLATVIWQSWSTANENPVNNLRTD